VTNANRQVSYRQPIGAATNPGFDNPFWTILNNRSNTAVNRLIGNTELSYDILNWLNLRANVGVDTYSDRRSDFINAESAISPGGSYTEQTIGETQWNTNLFARATHRFSGRISGSALVGFNYNSRQFNSVGANVLGFIVPNAPPNLLNSNPNTRTAFNDAETVRTSAGFTQLDAELFDQLFLTATGRIEAASTFGPEANSVFFYPSLSAAWQFSKLLGRQQRPELRQAAGLVRRGGPPARRVPEPDHLRAHELRRKLGRHPGGQPVRRGRLFAFPDGGQPQHPARTQVGGGRRPRPALSSTTASASAPRRTTTAPPTPSWPWTWPLPRVSPRRRSMPPRSRTRAWSSAWSPAGSAPSTSPGRLTSSGSTTATR
jgi:hypothetical protein